jgi:hypothetical protein
MAESHTRATDKSSAGRRARNRGIAFERTVARYFGGERVPMSGALGGKWKGDVIIYGLQAQCKRTKALATQRRWLEHDGSDILIQADPGERIDKALVVMTAKTFKQLMEGRHADTPLGK